MKFQQIRNATIRLQYGGVCFLVDPWLQRKGTGMRAKTPWPEKNSIASPLVELPMAVEKITADVDALLITHIHPDHFDAETAERLDKTLPAFVQNERDREEMQRRGYQCVEVLNQAGTLFRAVTITRTPGQHGVSSEKNAGPVCGAVFSAPGEKTLYLAGDTIFYPEVEQVLATRRPEVVVLNACGAELAEKGRLIMGKEDVLSVCHAVPKALVIASHMEAVNHATVTRKELAAFLREQGVLEQIRIPEDGECYNI